MKKIAFTGFIASMLLGSAFADTIDPASIVPLTTKKYVDDGLIYVYRLKANKDSVYTKDQVYTKTESDAKYLTSVEPYVGTNGVAINNHNVGLNVNAQAGSMYVYTSNGWSELSVEDEWNAETFDPEPNQDPEP